MTALGWNPRVLLQEGIGSTYRWYVEQEDFRKTVATTPNG